MVRAIDRQSNETKPALFSARGNERFISNADTERFAMMTACPAARARNLTPRNALLVQRRDKIVTAAVVSYRDDWPGF
ncbi:MULTISPECIES: hypothetical protein [unclassified Bradyrhizobium]|uniref:hypothetical protein n=1 Tax=unclassified Bradyrhizobium TaxID=2631580 RepID=UPI001E400E88|nr:MULTISPECIES: hypothetical protein [Bradyrhizobium]UFW71262.1 hypothetical protein BcanWU425_31950 [Bradyrhizobium canariense]WOH57518.1 hypothetical protein RX329_35710 [Bradyrhizobium sp. BWC-3-1]